MKGSWHGGKGSTPRIVDIKKYNDNWDRIFNKKSDNNNNNKNNDNIQKSKVEKPPFNGK